MIYPNRITLIVSLAQLETAKCISRALDPDVGGYEAFSQRCTKDGVEYAIYSSQCTAEFAVSAPGLLASPESLLAVALEDYSARWPALPCPTLAEVAAFSLDVRCFIDADPVGYAPVIASNF
jgi:hypothetical protein